MDMLPTTFAAVWFFFSTLLFSKLVNYVSGLLLQMSTVVAGDHGATLSTGLLSPCRALWGLV